MAQVLLLVDDDDGVRKVLAKILSKEGYHVETAADRAGAIQILDDVPLDLVLLDINLEGESGLDLLKDLREAHPNLPVLMLTGMGYDEELIQEALRSKATAFLSKTMPFAQMKLEIRHALKAPGP